ncbi:hypothetical protein FA15DRAFT_674926 [Coprinopsis marcescibilis]|uniref:PCI domain-containing protein n=1 Tax=Coprinopsis marcescibilis TaxID=230819 RepID=A0A5C3KSX6_COPMA|nr:hypothetical protein FA15DRAFT_674926 [Coprinopsis marcescibilis]
MDLGSNFSAKLEPFLLMGKSMRGAAAAKLIQDATAAPGVLVFSELLELPNIRELEKNEQYSKFYSLLQLFAYKTYEDYLRSKDSLPPLTTNQITKLKHLSIVSLASERRILPYDLLLNSLDITTVRELEDLIIDAIYQDILRGKLDQKEKQLEVEYTMGRDVQPEKLDDLLDILRNWAQTTSQVLAALDNKIHTISSNAAAQKVYQIEYDEALQKTLKDVSEKGGRHDRDKDRTYDRENAGGAGGSGSGSLGAARRKLFDRGGREERSGREDRENSMDVDEPYEPGNSSKSSKNRKASQESMKPVRKRNKI